MRKFIDSNQLFNDNPKLYNDLMEYICGRKSVVFDIEYSGLIEMQLFVRYIEYLKKQGRVK